MTNLNIESATIVRDIETDLPDDLRVVLAKWRARVNEDPTLDDTDRDRFYALEFGRGFAQRVFRHRIMANAGENQSLAPKTLVSVMGFAWQPCAFLTAWFNNPEEGRNLERVEIISTEDSLNREIEGMGLRDLIHRISGFPLDRIHTHIVEADDETALYQEVTKTIRPEATNGEVVFDITGGKKSMSNALALAGFVKNVTMVYMDYREYSHEGNRPVAGTEYPRVLRSPLADLLISKLQSFELRFNRADFHSARDSAEELSDGFPPLRFLVRMAGAYEAWSGFRLLSPELSSATTDNREILQSAGDLFSFSEEESTAIESLLPDVFKRLRPHTSIMRILTKLAEVGGYPGNDRQDGFWLVLNHLAAVLRAEQRRDFTRAAVFLSGAIERYLCWLLWSKPPHINANKTDGVVLTPEQMNQYYDFPIPVKPEDRKDAIPKKLHLNEAMRLVNVLHGDSYVKSNDVAILMDIAKARNQSEYTHGFIPRVVSEKDLEDWLRFGMEFISRCLDESGEKRSEEIRIKELKERLEDFKFPELSDKDTKRLEHFIAHAYSRKGI